MKKRGLLILFFILFSSIVYAEPDIRFNHIFVDDYISSGKDLVIDVSIENTGGKSLSNLKISAYLIGTGIRDVKYSDKITIGEKETTSLFLYLGDVDPGVYYLRLMVQESHIRRVKYREIVIV